MLKKNICLSLFKQDFTNLFFWGDGGTAGGSGIPTAWPESYSVTFEKGHNLLWSCSCISPWHRCPGTSLAHTQISIWWNRWLTFEKITNLCSSQGMGLKRNTDFTGRHQPIDAILGPVWPPSVASLWNVTLLPPKSWGPLGNSFGL